MTKGIIYGVLLGLFLLSGCSILGHLGGKHSPAIVADIMEDAAELIELMGDNVESIIILKMWWLIPACLLGLGAAAVLMVLKQVQLAIALAAGFGVTLVLSITVFKHFSLIGYVVLGIGLLIAGYTLYRAWLKQKALEQSVKTTDKTKQFLGETSKQVMFGDKDSHGAAGKIQSPATEKIIAKIRGKK